MRARAQETVFFRPTLRCGHTSSITPHARVYYWLAGLGPHAERLGRPPGFQITGIARFGRYDGGCSDQREHLIARMHAHTGCRPDMLGCRHAGRCWQAFARPPGCGRARTQANLVDDSRDPEVRRTGVVRAPGAVVKQHMLPWAGAGGDIRSAAPSTYMLTMACVGKEMSERAAVQMRKRSLRRARARTHSVPCTPWHRRRRRSGVEASLQGWSRLRVRPSLEKKMTF